jgi:transposase InsO family protein
MKDLLVFAGMSKQAFHQMLRRNNYREEERQQLLPLIHEIRRDHPRMGARDMYIKILPLTMGRDQFERFCFNSGFRVNPLKNFRKTTNSLGVTRFPNLIKDKKLTGVNQVFVSDITYYEMGSRFYYLTLIMDLYNREIVGWSASDNLRTECTTIPALHKLFYQRGKSNIKGAIIHSDGGGQYYCKEFLEITKDLLINSMTEEKVFENSHAERLNGIIKNNYLYSYNPRNLVSLRKLLSKAVYMYNTAKPHSSLKRLTPQSFRMKLTIDNENNSKKSYFPLPTVNHIHTLNSFIKNKKVNAI